MTKYVNNEYITKMLEQDKLLIAKLFEYES